MNAPSKWTISIPPPMPSFNLTSRPSSSMARRFQCPRQKGNPRKSDGKGIGKGVEEGARLSPLLILIDARLVEPHARVC